VIFLAVAKVLSLKQTNRGVSTPVRHHSLFQTSKTAVRHASCIPGVGDVYMWRTYDRDHVIGYFFVFVLIILYSLYLEYDSPLVPSASGLVGKMAELHSYYPSSPSDKRKKAYKSGRYIIQRKRGEGKESPLTLTPPHVVRRLLLLHSFWAGTS
jgi:hypothetical protein